jgi:DNA-directed RNA polymerase subunit F
MTSEHLIPTECEGAPEKPELTQNVRETVEYLEAVADPETPKLMETLADLAAIGKKHIINKEG